jgi:alkanesulfonate monooxygenase SsuD/methylene tetrahydromethanopterin reductase-like flavin-dependent oxidoreductase (luciferase family)
MARRITWGNVRSQRRIAYPSGMRFAIDIPNFGAFADPRLTADVARDAEAAGWDAVWVWDHVMRDPADPHADPYVLLAAIALATSRIRLGPMVTPLARRRPWHLAREAVTLDHLSGGRLTLGVGAGSRTHEFATFGDPADLRTRAAMLDEGLAVVEGLWSGEPFSFGGDHFRVDGATFLPRPLQRPRIPIWVAATWPIRAPLRRAARWDGVWPLRRDGRGNSIPLTPDDVRGVAAAIAEERSAAGRDPAEPFDILVAGVTPGDHPAAAAARTGEFTEAGATWWTERINPVRGSLEQMRERVRQGPPRP